MPSCHHYAQLPLRGELQGTGATYAGDKGLSVGSVAPALLKK